MQHDDNIAPTSASRNSWLSANLGLLAVTTVLGVGLWSACGLLKDFVMIVPVIFQLAMLLLLGAGVFQSRAAWQWIYGGPAGH